MTLLESDNKTQLSSSVYKDFLATDGYSRASSNNDSNKRYLCRDKNWFKHCLRYNTKCFYCH